jgi:hypothetical protein
MSITTANSSTSSFGSSPARPAAGQSRVARALRRIQRRRYLAARRAHERQDLTDGYIDRHGQVQNDASALVAFAQR